MAVGDLAFYYTLYLCIGHSKLLITQQSCESFHVSRMNRWIVIWPMFVAEYFPQFGGNWKWLSLQSVRVHLRDSSRRRISFSGLVRVYKKKSQAKRGTKTIFVTELSNSSYSATTSKTHSPAATNRWIFFDTYKITLQKTLTGDSWLVQNLRSFLIIDSYET